MLTKKIKMQGGYLELLGTIHCEWPLRNSKLPSSIGPMDEIMAILKVILDCGSLTKLINDFEIDLRKRIRKEQASKT